MLWHEKHFLLNEQNSHGSEASKYLIIIVFWMRSSQHPHLIFPTEILFFLSLFRLFKCIMSFHFQVFISTQHKIRELLKEKKIVYEISRLYGFTNKIKINREHGELN